MSRYVLCLYLLKVRLYLRSSARNSPRGLNFEDVKLTYTSVNSMVMVGGGGGGARARANRPLNCRTVKIHNARKVEF